MEGERDGEVRMKRGRNGGEIERGAMRRGRGGGKEREERRERNRKGMIGVVDGGIKEKGGERERGRVLKGDQ